MKGILINDKKYLYTDMSLFYETIDNLKSEYNWLLTDYECNIYPTKSLQVNRDDYLWMGKREIDQLLFNNIQFIWGAFSGFKKCIELTEVLKYPLPKSKKDFFMDGNISIQHPLASIEIVSYDSTLAFMISDDNIINQFKKADIKSHDLHDYLKFIT